MSSHSSPDNIIETTRCAILSDPLSNAGTLVAVWISTISSDSCYYAQLTFIRYRQVFTPNILLLHAKDMTNIGRLVGVLCINYQSASLSPFYKLVSTSSIRIRYSNQTLSCEFEFHMILTIHGSCWLIEARGTAVGVVSVQRLETGRLQRSDWENWNQSVYTVLGLRSVAKHQHRTMQWLCSSLPSVSPSLMVHPV